MAPVKGYRFTWGGVPFFGQNLLFLIGRDARLQKNTVKKQYGRHLFVNAPVQNRQAKSEKKTVFFNFLTSIFWFATSFFAVPQVAGPGGGFLSFWTRFRTDFRRFVIAENTGFYSVFLFSACSTASFKVSKNLVNYAVLCYGVNENIVNTSVFWRWIYSVFGNLTLKNHGICSGFCFSPRKNTVNNSNFAVFFMFFVTFWTALVRYTWLSNSARFFFSDNQYFRMFLVSMADIIGSYERLPNDAVRAVAVAKRREYVSKPPPRNHHPIS